MAINRKKIFDITKGRCFYCGCFININDFHVDHFYPRCDGGLIKVPACPECNMCKSNLSIEEFRYKLSVGLHETFQGKMFQKYYRVKPKPIKFYYEGVYDVGNL